MTTKLDIAPATPRELVLARIIDAPRAAVWRCWSEPELLMRWFCPAPWKTVAADMDLRAGGIFSTTMRSPEGQEFPNTGVFLDVVPGERLAFTDAFVAAWVPSDKPFMTAVITFEDEGAATRYIARVGHWTDEDVKAHEEMGFHDGWGMAADQLEAVARSLSA
ncbi:SRPBCC family protein [Methylobrevis pamukkalensis]|uniref:Activator of Hsp90 ATPase homologue 1/2-like C-terminal domain-containing protein n=1 Tax=Methylobrevis pamukkalensis TaxID=1439726 RepID=A0A1E3GZ24_9HYPH|nr:SRPBCC family protein [Methylobrevis pamukkalensis]ODN69282.1 hypothetical protein A6302_03402 [Methylobrevis pamukkalensis]